VPTTLNAGQSLTFTATFTIGRRIGSLTLTRMDRLAERSASNRHDAGAAVSESSDRKLRQRDRGATKNNRIADGGGASVTIFIQFKRSGVHANRIVVACNLGAGKARRLLTFAPAGGAASLRLRLRATLPIHR
jgi:hypothetical protein